MYLPKELWPSFKTEFLGLYTEATGKTNPDHEIHIEQFQMMCGARECYIRGKTCDQVYDFMGDEMSWNVEVTFSLTDSDNTQFDVTVPMRHLFIEGEDLLRSHKGDCFLGIFSNTETSNQNSIYLGNLFM